MTTEWLISIAREVASALKPLLTGTRFQVKLTGHGLKLRCVANIAGAESFNSERLLDIHRAMSRAYPLIDVTRINGLK